MNYNLKGKKILITGSTGGIGNALCKKFIENESKIIFTSSNHDKLDILKDKFGKHHSYYYLDLLNSKELIAQVKLISNENKDLDILINNAGITKDNLILRMNEEQWNDVINVNLNSSFHIIKHILQK